MNGQKNSTKNFETMHHTRRRREAVLMYNINDLFQYSYPSDSSNRNADGYAVLLFYNFLIYLGNE